eukprot:COSAG02_NODE_10133_length_2013_cov_8.890625_1_plen_74_part_10
MHGNGGVVLDSHRTARHAWQGPCRVAEVRCYGQGGQGTRDHAHAAMGFGALAVAYITLPLLPSVTHVVCVFCSL